MSQLPFERIWRASPRASILVEANRVIASSDAAQRLLGDALEGRDVLTLFDDDGLAGFLRLCAGSSSPLPRRLRIRDREDAPLLRADGARVGRGERGPLVLLELRPQVEASARLQELDRRLEALRFAHRDLRSQADALELQNRQLREFVTMLGHELRNPLVGIATAFDLFEGEDDAAKARALEVGSRQLGHVRRLVDDLLDLRKVEQGELSLRKAPCDLSHVVRQVVEPLARTFAEREIRLSVELPSDPVVIEGDETRLLQALANLVQNALAHGGPGGRVWIRLLAHGDELCLEVADDGEGFSPEVAERLFDAFHQEPQAIDRSRGGIGVGLTVARRLAELHGGRLEAESPGPGEGATFRIRLPWQRPSAAPPAPTASSSTPSSRAKGTLPSLSILVVDDQVDSVELLRMVLEREGHSVREAYDGQGALAAVAEERPEVVLLDIGLPDIDGFEVARRLRSDYGATPLIVALSGYGSAEDKRRGVEAGFDHHLVKPVRGKELRAELARLWSERG